MISDKIKLKRLMTIMLVWPILFGFVKYYDDYFIELVVSGVPAIIMVSVWMIYPYGRLTWVDRIFIFIAGFLIYYTFWFVGWLNGNIEDVLKYVSINSIIIYLIFIVIFSLPALLFVYLHQKTFKIHSSFMHNYWISISVTLISLIPLGIDNMIIRFAEIDFLEFDLIAFSAILFWQGSMVMLLPVKQ